MGPSLVLIIMGVLGYSEYHAGNQLFSVALNLRYLVAGLFLFSAVMQFVGLALIYNLDKKTLAIMNAELGHTADESTDAPATEAVAEVEAV